MDKNVIIIPARYASVRFPGKPLADIFGKSLIVRIYEQVSNLDFIHEILVATDDERIFGHCRSYGIPVRMTASHHTSGTDRVAEVARDFPPDVRILNIQGDEPFLCQEDIQSLIRTLEKSNGGIATLVCRIDQMEAIHNVNRVKVVFNQQMEAIYFSRLPIPYHRNITLGNTYMQHVGVYAFYNYRLQEITSLPIGFYEQCEGLEQLRWIEAGYPIQVGWASGTLFSIDTPEDLQEARLLWKIKHDAQL